MSMVYSIASIIKNAFLIISVLFYPTHLLCGMLSMLRVTFLKLWGIV